MAVLVFGSATAQSANGSEPKAWTAQWISAPHVPPKGEAVLQFRKSIDLPQKPQKFLVDVSADNQFTFSVNGNRVGSGPSRGDLAHWRYETYDIAPFLQAGSNVLAATVWNFGTHAAIAQMSDRLAFLVHGENASESAADTNESWQVAEDRSITTIRPSVHGYYAAEPGERIDAKWALKWNNENSNTAIFGQAVVLGRAVLREGRDSPNNWQLVADPLPQMEMTAAPPGKVVRSAGAGVLHGFPETGFAIAARTEASILIDNGQLTTGYPALMVSSGAGATIRLTYAEALVGENRNKGNRNQIEGKHIEGLSDEFLPSGSADAYEFMPLAWRTWRYLQLDVKTTEQPLRLEGLHTWFTAYPFAERAHFRSDDSSLKPIWDVGWRTARLDAHDTYMDTPYWERLQYIGDTRIQALISYAVAGDDRLARQAIEAFNNSRIPDGLTQSRYPSSLVQMIPTFSLLWIGMVHDFWLYRGDSEFVRSQLPGTRTVLDWYL
ncbi:MAG TPA: family 78 glycoside hydrolase catalytic domain, partial [Terriglobales bacterium]|nr:family 78 glycoside hydrolase catalytic domain [Terriglobales bacterium]